MWIRVYIRIYGVIIAKRYDPFYFFSTSVLSAPLW
jgi:hypothetical protein